MAMERKVKDLCKSCKADLEGKMKIKMKMKTSNAEVTDIEPMV